MKDDQISPLKDKLSPREDQVVVTFAPSLSSFSPEEAAANSEGLLFLKVENAGHCVQPVFEVGKKQL